MNVAILLGGGKKASAGNEVGKGCDWILIVKRALHLHYRYQMREKGRRKVDAEPQAGVRSLTWRGTRQLDKRVTTERSRELQGDGGNRMDSVL